MPRPKHLEASDAVMDGVVSELSVAELCFSRGHGAQESSAHDRSRGWHGELIRSRALARHAPARGQLARGQGNEIAVDSTGIRHAPARVAMDEAQDRGIWIRLRETIRNRRPA
jgi:hypothetical protein